MSASNKKKLRKEQKAAALSEKQKREQQEAKKLKIWTSVFAVVMAAVILIAVAVPALNPDSGYVNGIFHRTVTAYEINGNKISNAELNYFFIDAINEYQNSVYEQYYQSFGQYWNLMLGFDPSKPLNEQKYNDTNKTWAEHFAETAINTAKDTYAVYLAAGEAKHTLTETEKKNMNDYFNSLDLYAQVYGAVDADAYLRQSYGVSANESSYKKYYEICTIASSYLTKYSDSLEFNKDQLRAFESQEDRFDNYSVVSYDYYTMNYTSYLGDKPKDENGKETDWTDEQKAEAREKLKADMEILVAAGIIDKETFDKAIQALEINKPDEDTSKNETNTENKTEPDANTEDKAETDTEDKTEDKTETDTEDKTEDKTETDTEDKTEDKTESNKKLPTATEVKRAYFANISFNEEIIEWLKSNDRTKGNLKAFELKTYKSNKDLPADHQHGTDDCTCEYTVDGYTIILFGEKDIQDYKLVNVRHILVKFEGGTKDKDGKLTYSQEEKDKAKAEAEKLLADWNAGTANEETFGELANKESDDQNGKVTNGGLYEDVYKGQMVEAFENWCFAPDRKAGDTGLVETEYGWHVMYFSSYDEMTMRDKLVEYDLRMDTTEKWHDGLVAALNCSEGNLFFFNEFIVKKA